MWLEESGKLKKFSDLIGNRTRDLPACIIVPESTKLPLAPSLPRKPQFYDNGFRYGLQLSNNISA
jgi:hypothetical protein